MNIKRINMYNSENVRYRIEVNKVMEHYMIYVDDEFYASAENLNEVDEEIEDIRNVYRLRY